MSLNEPKFIQLYQYGTFLWSTANVAAFPYIGGGSVCIDHAHVQCFMCQGKSSVWESREGCPQQSAQLAIKTDGLDASLLALLFFSRSLRIQVHGQAALASFVVFHLSVKQ
eukprot:1161218-Pelagomonas_calceolata.AAC.8